MPGGGGGCLFEGRHVIEGGICLIIFLIWWEFIQMGRLFEVRASSRIEMKMMQNLSFQDKYFCLQSTNTNKRGAYVQVHFQVKF